MFDTKDAKELPQYNGVSKGEYWRRKISNYLIARCPDIAEPLEWAERGRETITREKLESMNFVGEYGVKNERRASSGMCTAIVACVPATMRTSKTWGWQAITMARTPLQRPRS